LAAKAKIPESLAPTIIGWVKVGPEAAGLQRVHWTFQEPTNDLYRTHGIAVSEETMRPLTEGSVTQASGHRHDIHVYRPGYAFGRCTGSALIGRRARWFKWGRRRPVRKY